jgi:hypothetical protein
VRTGISLVPFVEQDPDTRNWKIEQSCMSAWPTWGFRDLALPQAPKSTTCTGAARARIIPIATPRMQCTSTALRKNLGALSCRAASAVKDASRPMSAALQRGVELVYCATKAMSFSRVGLLAKRACTRPANSSLSCPGPRSNLPCQHARDVSAAPALEAKIPELKQSTEG